MKTFFHPITTACAMLFFLFSCTKQKREEPTAKEIPMSAASASGCKPVVMGVHSGPPGFATWKTVMQKWFDNAGRLAFLKAGLHLDEDGFSSYPLHLEWGEVTYNANQVYVKNVPKNDTIIRVTLDAQQRPVASYYFYNYEFEPDDIDTSYYYFTGSRLDSILSINTNVFSFTPEFEFHKYIFNYDAFSNLVQMHDVRSSNNSTPFTNTTTLTYNYAQPVADMLSLFLVDRQYKLLEYMGLLHFPIHHALTNVNAQGFPFPPLQFSQHTLLANGLVSSYVKDIPSGFFKSTIYVGWDCGTTNNSVNRQKNAINSFEDFQTLYLTK